MIGGSMLTVWQIIAQHGQVAGIGIAAYLAWRVGQKQSSINKQLLELQDYVAVMVVPVQAEPGKRGTVIDLLSIANASARPV